MLRSVSMSCIPPIYKAEARTGVHAIPVYHTQSERRFGHRHRNLHDHPPTQSPPLNGTFGRRFDDNTNKNKNIIGSASLKLASSTGERRLDKQKIDECIKVDAVFDEYNAEVKCTMIKKKILLDTEDLFDLHHLNHEQPSPPTTPYRHLLHDDCIESARLEEEIQRIDAGYEALRQIADPMADSFKRLGMLDAYTCATESGIGGSGSGGVNTTLFSSAFSKVDDMLNNKSRRAKSRSRISR